MSVRLAPFMERSGVLPITQFVYRKGLGTCDVLLCVSHTLTSALESGQEARIVQIDFSVAVDRFNHQGILDKLCSVGVRCSVLSICNSFYQIDHSTLWWTVVRVNWSMLCQKYGREVFWPVIIPPVHLRAFFHSGEYADRLCRGFHFVISCAIPRL